MKYETPEQRRAYDQLTASAHATSAANVPAKARLLVVIPFRDKWSLTASCLESLWGQDLTDLEVLVALVDNGSVERETQEGIAAVQKKDLPTGLGLKHLRYDIPFNYSRLNNLAVKDCSGFAATHVALLNNDVVMTERDTLRQLTLFLVRHPVAGSVGCTLLYPDLSIQHLCIAVGCKIVGAHPFKGHRLETADAWYREPRPVGGATAALLVVDHALYLQVGGLDEGLPSCYQDVDLALKLQAAGRINWVLPWVRAIHYETQTRSPIHSWDEVSLMYERWSTMLTHNPYLSRSLSRWSEQPALSLGEGDFPWRWLR